MFKNYNEQNQFAIKTILLIFIIKKKPNQNKQTKATTPTESWDFFLPLLEKKKGHKFRSFPNILDNLFKVAYSQYKKFSYKDKMRETNIL